MRRFQPILLCLALSSCNTCLDARGVPFATPDGGIADVATEDAGPDDAVASDLISVRDMPVARDVAADAPPDDDVLLCVPESDADLCARLMLQCGAGSGVDNCAEPRDIAECGPCDANGTCGASQQCSCDAGYDGDGVVCTDIDECALGADDCDARLNCTNLPGTFQCSSCPPGFLDVNGDGTLCRDIDECADNTDNCAAEVSCVNSDGGFSCTACPAGYVDDNGDGTSCTDVDECTSGGDNCDANATCSNTPGSFTCACNPGFSGAGVVCTPVQLVKQVFLLDRDFTGFNETATVPAYDPLKSVPFGSMNTNSDVIEARLVDVVLDTSGSVSMERFADAGTVSAAIHVVEFDQARVENGRFTMGGTSETVPFAAPVDPSRAFVVATHRADFGDILVPGEYQVRTSFDANGVMFSRGSDNSTGLAGGWWLVEATEGHFTAQHVDVAITGLSDCGSVTIPSTARDRSFVVYSASYDGGALSSGAQVTCELAQDTQVDCCRLTVAGTNDVLDIRVSIVTFAPWTVGNVQHGSEVLANGTNNRTFGISNVGNDSIAWLGRITPMAPSANAFAGGVDDPHGFVKALLQGNNDIELRRQTPANEDVWVTWEVIEWPD